MSIPLIDLSYVQSLSGNDPAYMRDIINIYIDTMTPGLAKLNKLIKETDDFEAIHKQAHFLKSSAGIVKVADLYNNLVDIDMTARQKTNKEHIAEVLITVEKDYKAALPLLTKERDRNSRKVK